jgi:hypothetical protein
MKCRLSLLQAWIYRKRFLKVSDGALRVTFLGVDEAPDVVGLGIGRIDLDRFGAVGNGAVEVVVFDIKDGPVAIDR